MSRKKEIKPKYRVGQIVYCRPWLRGNGLSVYKCLVIQVNFVGGNPYYSLQIVDTGFGLYVIYESEISRRKERLIKEAMMEIEKVYTPYLNKLNERLLQLQELK